MDYHWNIGTGTSVTVVTAPAGSVDPRRTGVRSTGSYWGANGENIDTRSGNLNFTLPLLNAQGRNGHGVAISLNYNSQLWRQQASKTWRLGRDTGFGFGWRLLAGSLTPYWIDYYTVGHWIFTDNTGAEYRLDQQSNGVWTSKEIHVSFDSLTNRLYFNNGTFWYMGVLSQGNEEDSGTLYPTLIQDSNGDQIILTYARGVQAAQDYSSSRITQIQDVRMQNNWSYGFSYSNDAAPHLTSITSNVADAMNYTFTYSAPGTLLKSPFGAEAFGTTRRLERVEQTPVGLKHQFDYDTVGAGELTKVTFPYGGYFRWAYRDFSYSGGRKIREVYRRYMNDQVAQAGLPAEDEFQFTFDDAGDANRSFHQYTKMKLVSPDALRQWTFDLTSGATFGLLKQLDAGPSAVGSAMLRREKYTWATPASSPPYISEQIAGINPDHSTTANRRFMKTKQTLDAYGNVTKQEVFHYANSEASIPATPARVSDIAYENSPAHLQAYVRNRLKSLTVTEGTTVLVPVTNKYDVYSTAMTAPTAGTYSLHDPAYTASNLTRGNITETATLGGGNPVATSYDILGNVVGRSQTGATPYSIAISTQPSTNYAVPTAITPNSNSNLTTSTEWSTSLQVEKVTAPNNAITDPVYDSATRRLVSTTSPHGAITGYSYNDTQRQVTATTNEHWTRTTMDGFGRTVLTEIGYTPSGGTGVVESKVETIYRACACSPVGKVWKVSTPYKTTASYHTEYVYDELGRTTQVKLPDSQGTTIFDYTGNPGDTVKATDPAGKWKKYVSDAMGNLVKVIEPDPDGGADLQTDYEYTPLDQLKKLTQARTVGQQQATQTRTYTYTGSRLDSVETPESGKTEYFYYGNGDLERRKDAKGQEVKYFYDSLRRIDYIERWAKPVANQPAVLQPCQTTYFTYDIKTADTTLGSEYSWGRLTEARWGVGTGCPAEMAEQYAYNGVGLLPLMKRLEFTKTDGTGYLDGHYTWDNEGRMIGEDYPNNGSQGTQSPSMAYQRNLMGQVSGVQRLHQTPGGVIPVNVASNIVYNERGQLDSMNWLGRSLDNTFNNLGQLTRMTSPEGTAFDEEYVFPAGANSGRISQKIDRQTPGGGTETISYLYDSLQRLTKAETPGSTPADWGQMFGYDGFGNLTSKSATKGTGVPAMSVTVDAATNRLSGTPFEFDANGNMTKMPNLTGTIALEYDVENRLAKNDAGQPYVYDASGRRVLEGNNVITFWNVAGSRVGRYQLGSLSNGVWTFTTLSTSAYLEGRLIGEKVGAGFTGAADNFTAVVVDRLGSVRVRGTTRYRYYPYGEEMGTQTGNGVVKFGTYERQGFGNNQIDYADQRYYAGTWGRFATVDPVLTSNVASSRLGDPGTWNLYGYANNDPVDFLDPDGEEPITTLQFSQWIGPARSGASWSFGITVTSQPGGVHYSPMINIWIAGSGRRPWSMNHQRTDAVRAAIYAVDNDINFGPEILDCMAGIESDWRPNARAGSHRGLYQMNPEYWRATGTGLPYSFVNDVGVSTAVVVAGLYAKAANGLGSNRALGEMLSRSPLLPASLIHQALQLHRGHSSSVVNNTYANAIRWCEQEMKRGNVGRARDWIYWYKQWESSR
ncbi:MAG: RHS repeat-associated core domain-containing protein [Bryobacteraceae bacterium]